MHTTLQNLIFYSVLPISILFLIERWFLFFMRQTEARVNFIKSSIWFHPNSISKARYIMGVCSVLIYIYFSKEFAIFFFGFWMISDVTDGTIAKHFDLTTEEGKVIDPLSDKLLYFPPMFFASYLDILSLKLIFIFLFFDLASQFSRFFIKEKAANLFGKTKTFIAVLTISITFLQEVYFENQILVLGDTLLSCTIFLAFCSFFFKLVPNNWYANILSLLNLTCGILGILLIIMEYKPIYALILIFIGQFLDLFDGRAAEKWGSTPRGEVLDDLADGTNFGGTIALIIFQAIEDKITAVIIASIYFVSAVYRLIRFLSDKKEANVALGVELFKGLPTPAAALFTGGGVLVISHFNYIFLGLSAFFQIVFVSILSSILMISHLPYIHFGRVVLPKIPKMVKVILCGFFVALIGFSLKKPDEVYLAFFVFICAVLYLFLGIRYKSNHA